MKLEHLLESTDYAMARALLTKLRAHAATMEFLISSGSAGDFAVNKSELVFAFVLTEKGGKRAKEEIASGERMPADIRVRGFLKKLADELGKSMDDGYQIQTLKGGKKKERTDVKQKDLLFDQLEKDMVMNGRVQTTALGPAIGFVIKNPA